MEKQIKKHIRRLIVIMIIMISSFSYATEIPAEDVSHKDDDFKRNYPVLGYAVGTPAAFLNFIVGYYFNDYGIHFTGFPGYSDDFAGMQLNLVYKVYEKKHLLHSVALIGGLMNMSAESDDPDAEDFHWRYSGVAYNINFYGLYAELGVMVGKGNSNIAPFFIAVQSGYVHRFTWL